MEDTIAAISTALGVGAISIIRVSGNDSIKIVNEIFKGKDLTKQNTHTIHYGYIVDNEKIIDEVLVSIMKSPKTFTKEDIVEINCHGGIATTNKVLELVLNKGARLAEPGEFTKRAFLNGRIDLIEADGIMNLISSKTDKARQLSINQLSGKVSNNIAYLREELIKIISNIEKDYKKLIREIKKYYQYDIYIVGYYSVNTNNYLNKGIRKLNNIYRNDKDVIYIDTYTLFESNKSYRSRSQSIYPNNKGYEAISRQIVLKTSKKLENSRNN